MHLFRQNNNWLRYRTISKIKENNPNLFESGFKYRLKQAKDYIFSSKGWLPIGSVVLISVIISCFIDIRWLNFINISPETAKILIDQRTGNIAAIMSITLVVVGFLISNLAIKDSISYKLLFKDSKLYSIFYYILFLLGFLFVTSSLRDTLTPTHFTNLVVYGTYLAIIGLILIGYLFKRIIRFTSDKYIKNLMNQELLNEAKENLRLIRLQETSKQIFKEKMEVGNISNYSPFENFKTKTNSFRFSKPKNKKSSDIIYTITDINLNKIDKIISQKRRKDDRIIYKPTLSIGAEIHLNDKILWQKSVEDSDKKKKRIIKHSFLFKKCSDEEKYDVKKYFDEKFETASINNNHFELERLLSSYFKLYELHIETNIKEYTILDDIKRLILKASQRAIANNNNEILLKLDRFRNNLRFLSLGANQINIFNQFINFPIYLYQYAQKLKKENSILIEDIYEECTEGTAHSYKSIINNIGFLFENNTIEIQKSLNIFYEQSYEAFDYLLYEMVKHKDLNSFKFAIEEYNQIYKRYLRSDYDLKSEINQLELKNQDGKNNIRIRELCNDYKTKSKFENLWKHGLVGIKNWLFFLYSKKIYLIEDLQKFLQILEAKSNYLNSTLDDIILFRNYSHQYLGWNSWDFMKRRSGVMYSPTEAREWMLQGILIDRIRNNILYFSRDQVNKEDLKDISNIYNTTQTYLDSLKKNFEIWKDVLKVESEDDLSNKIDTLLADLARYKRESDLTKSKGIASKPLSAEKALEFKNNVGKAWASKTQIRNLFKELGATDKLTTLTDSKFFGIHTYFEKMKSAFIGGIHYQSIGGLSSYGDQLGYEENQLFYTAIKASKYNKISDNNLLEVIKKSINKLQDNEVDPNLIIVPSEKYYTDKSLKEDKNFVENKGREKSSKEISKIKIGDYNDIPVIETHTQWLNNKIITCNFKSAFKMKIAENEVWYNNELEVYVREVSDSEAQNLLDENPNKWKETEDDNRLTNLQALDLIKTSVVVKIGSQFEFEILDLNSFIIGEIEEQN